MKPEIASLHERMSKGGDWRTFRDEIAALHATASTEEDFVRLLQAHRNLISVAQYTYDEETYAKLLPIAEAEYRSFLIREAMEDGTINPVLLDRVTRREVEAGRLDPKNEFRTLAKSGAAVFGDSAIDNAHRCRHGDWFAYGMTAAALIAVVLASFSISPLWLIVVAFLVGWYVNERERLRIVAEVKARRLSEEAERAKTK